MISWWLRTSCGVSASKFQLPSGFWISNDSSERLNSLAPENVMLSSNSYFSPLFNSLCVLCVWSKVKCGSFFNTHQCNLWCDMIWYDMGVVCVLYRARMAMSLNRNTWKLRFFGSLDDIPLKPPSRINTLLVVFFGGSSTWFGVVVVVVCIKRNDEI